MRQIHLAFVILASATLFGCQLPTLSSYHKGGSDQIRSDKTAIGDNSTMLFPDNQDETFQGFSLEAPETIFVKEIEQGTFIWERGSIPKERTYEGTLDLAGWFAVFVPEGQQENIWSGLSEKINFVVKDLKTGDIQRRSGVHGGWNLARQGLSIHMDESPPLEFDYSTMPSNAIHFERFNIEVFDDLPFMPEPDTTLRIHLEYMGFTSDPVRVNVRLMAN